MAGDSFAGLLPPGLLATGLPVRAPPRHNSNSESCTLLALVERNLTVVKR